MKKTILSSLLALAAMANLSAREVKTDVAADYGREFLDGRSNVTHTVKNVESRPGNLMIVNYYPQGWAVLSTNDVVRPVVAYSTSGALQWHSLPENFSFMVGELNRVIDRAVVAGGLPDRRWQEDASTKVSRAGENPTVAPLIKVHFNQSEPFNKYCPGSGKNKAIVGCVAVAMSQAMTVQRYPQQPKGYVSYSAPNYGLLEINFDEQRPYDWDKILSGANNYDEAARLMYHAGMAVKMDYGADGSGIPSNQINRISEAFVNNFGYNKNQVKYYYRESTRNWTQLINNELMAGRAVVYNGISTAASAGHSFNVDGYEEGGFYHINWGWGGYGDGWMILDDLRDAQQNLWFDTGHRIVIGMASEENPIQSVGLSDTRIEAGLPAGSALGMLTVNGGEVTSNYTIKVMGLYDSSIAGNKEVPFVVDGNMLRTTRPLTMNDNPTEIILQVDDSATGATLRQGFEIEVHAAESLEKSTSVSYDRNSSTFRFRTKHNVTATLTGPNGATIKTQVLEPLPELEINRSELPAGVSVLTLTCPGDTKTVKLVNK